MDGHNGIAASRRPRHGDGEHHAHPRAACVRESVVCVEEVKPLLKRWVQHWTDELAVVHARYLARAIHHRAGACKEAQNPSYRRASTVDVDAASSLPPPALMPSTASAAVPAAAAAPAAP